MLGCSSEKHASDLYASHGQDQKTRTKFDGPATMNCPALTQVLSNIALEFRDISGLSARIHQLHHDMGKGFSGWIRRIELEALEAGKVQSAHRSTPQTHVTLPIACSLLVEPRQSDI